MTKKMIAWIGAALLAGTLTVACSKDKKAETTPPVGGDTYGAPADTTTPPADTYGAPAEGGGEEAPASEE